MKTILLIHGPNLNLLGKRDPLHYGSLTLGKLENIVKRKAKINNFIIKSFQSNHEGALIDFIQKNSPKADGVIINAGALTHYSYALHDALMDAKLPAIEVHLSNIKDRENWRNKSVIKKVCLLAISGKKEKGYLEAVEVLRKYLNSNKPPMINMVIGNPIKQSKSPLLHGEIYKFLKLDAVTLPVSNSNVRKLVSKIKKESIGLAAVTMPFKKTVIPFLDSVDAIAKKINSVNTIINKNGKLFGYNTDVDGVQYALRNVKLKNKKVLLLGAGGAGRTVAAVIREQGGRLIYLNRKEEESIQMKKNFGGQSMKEQKLSAQDIDVVINATPVGMFPLTTSLSVPSKLISRHQTVFDLVYNPEATRLLKVSKSRGAKVISGIDMFIVQGIRQIELWTNKKIIDPKLVYQLKKLIIKG